MAMVRMTGASVGGVSLCVKAISLWVIFSSSIRSDRAYEQSVQSRNIMNRQRAHAAGADECSRRAGRGDLRLRRMIRRQAVRTFEIEHHARIERHGKRGIIKRLALGPSHDDFAAAQIKIERVQNTCMADRIGIYGARDGGKERIGPRAPFFVAGCRGKAHQSAEIDRMRVGNRVIRCRREPQNDVPCIVGRHCDETALSNDMMARDRVRPGDGVGKIIVSREIRAFHVSRFVQGKRGARHRRMIERQAWLHDDAARACYARGAAAPSSSANCR